MSALTCTCLRSVINLGNSIIGVSILAMPYCFKKCGILLSILLIIASGLITRAACHLVLKSAIMARRRNFEFLAFHTFGSTGKLCVEIGIIGFLIGVCVAFFVVVGDLGPVLTAKFLMIENTPQLRAEVLIFLGVFIAFPLGLLRKVDSLTSLSALSIGFYVYLILMILAEAVPKLIDGDWFQQINWWQPAGLLSSLPIFSMALSCQTQLFEFFDPLSDPSLKKMNSVINGAVQMCSIVYISVGLFGYIAFYDSPITGNILVRLTPSLTAEVIKLGFILSVVISFPLCLFPCRSSLHSLIFKQGIGHYDLQSSYMPDHRFRVLTCALVTATIGTAIMVPNIEFVLGLVGSTIGITICVIFPALIFLNLTTKNTNERRMAQLVCFIGFFILIACTFSTLHENNKPPEITLLPKPKTNEENKIQNPESGAAKKITESPKELNLDKPEVRNVKDIELKKEPGKESLKSMKVKEENKELDESKRQEPPIPQESIKNHNLPEKSAKIDDLDPEALKKEDKEINSQKRREEKEKKDEKNLNKQEELLQKLEAQHIEQKKILEEQKKLLEELKLHKESHNEQKIQNQDQPLQAKDPPLQPSLNILDNNNNPRLAVHPTAGNPAQKIPPPIPQLNQQPGLVVHPSAANPPQKVPPPIPQLNQQPNQKSDYKPLNIESQQSVLKPVPQQPAYQEAKQPALEQSVRQNNLQQSIQQLEIPQQKIPEKQSDQESFQPYVKQSVDYKPQEKPISDNFGKPDNKIIENSNEKYHYEQLNANNIGNIPINLNNEPHKEAIDEDKNRKVLSDNEQEETGSKNLNVQQKQQDAVRNEAILQNKAKILQKPIPVANLPAHNEYARRAAIDAVKDAPLLQEKINMSSDNALKNIDTIDHRQSIKNKRDVDSQLINMHIDNLNNDIKETSNNLLYNKNMQENLEKLAQNKVKAEVSSSASAAKHEMRRLLAQNISANDSYG